MDNQEKKLRVAVLFGGRSTEHEISIITALQVLDAFDSTRFATIPVYIDWEGYWYMGEELRYRENYMLSPEMKSKLTRVIMTGDPVSELIEAEPSQGWLKKKSPKHYPIDVFFPAFHGTFGEDGCIQGMLELIGAAYVGSGPRSCSTGMNKHAAKQILSRLDVPVLPDVLLDRREWDATKADVTAQQVTEHIPPPVMVKPCNLGSSIGISAAHDMEQLMVSLAGAFVFDHQVIVEPLLQDMYELNISVLEGNPPRFSAIERPKRDEEILTFEQKYVKGNKKNSGTAGEGMASMKRDINPPDVPETITDKVKSYARRAFEGMDCRGLVRFDFMVDRKEENVYFNEINLLPGSFAYYLWESATPRIPLTELLTELVHLALEEKKAKQRIRRRLEKRILSSRT